MSGIIATLGAQPADTCRRRWLGSITPRTGRDTGCTTRTAICGVKCAQVHYGASPFGCLPAELRAKVFEIIDACGTHVLRTFTPGAVIAGTHHLSEHAFCRAADLAGNPACIYAHLRGFRGGVSTDYARMQHVHVSWHPGGFEQGVRFVHGGGYRATLVAAVHGFFGNGN